jgi:general secretion pathway protein G
MTAFTSQSRYRIGRYPAGFTLIELLVTLAILSVLAVMTVPVAQVTIQRHKEETLRAALREIRQAIDAYKKAGDEGLFDVEADASGYPPNLAVLVDGVVKSQDTQGKKLYFLRRIPRDPMNEQTELSDEATWGKRSFDSEADDPREGNDVYDIYSLSDQEGLNGVPYKKW